MEIVVILAVLLVGGAVTYFVLGSRRRKRALTERQQASAQIDALEVEAGQALVRADERIRLADDELGFITVEFGEQVISQFRSALADARGSLTEAFRLNQLLHDEKPDTPDERRSMSQGIVRHCSNIETTLGEQTAAVSKLRESMRGLPDAVVSARGDIATVRERVEPARRALAAASDRYAESALRSVAPNVEQAERLIEFSERSLQIAEEKHSERLAIPASKALTVARESVSRADGLLRAVSDFEMEALSAESTLAAVIEDSRGDIIAARKVTERPADLGPAIERLRHETDAVSQQTGKRDPFETLSRLRDANSALDAIMDRITQKRNDEGRMRSQLPHAIDDAERQIAAATNIVDNYQAPVGPDARTRLAEARRMLDAARTESDTGTAVANARRAADLASEAARIAHNDIQQGGMYGMPGYGPQRGMYGRGGYGRGGYGRGGLGGGDMLTGILGGMVVGGLLDDMGDMFD
ncbi:hypothetical protein [Paramicrobacterium agarici]|uniref:hypothetical protein n=1 Tax=Paramicrobacterium agarici TaxID=630514 RepID=UPI0011506404|nr:hypothetical protein [Microbacterium agarici]TQO22487.1 hypothetical protein FB385_1318 [Microbacterium agarici]